jgi:hypothetical protein
VVFDVSIKNVKVGGVATDYAYKVTVFDAVKEVANNIYPATNFAGIWDAIPSGENGWGFNLALGTRGTPFGTWYTYGADGQPLWLVVPGGTWTTPWSFTGDIYQTTGTPYTQTYSPAQFQIWKVGTVTYQFSDKAHASMSWTMLDGTSGSKQMVPYVEVPQVYRDGVNYSGIWATLPAENGWGFSIQHGWSTIFGVWYTYDTDGKPLWVVLPGGTWTDAKTYEGTLYTATGSGFSKPWDQSAWHIAPAGTAKLLFNGQNDAIFTLTVNGVTNTKRVSRYERY